MPNFALTVRQRMKVDNISKWGYLSLTALAVIILDIATKFIAVTTLSPGQSIKVLPGIFHITLVLNKGAAFGLLKNHNSLFMALSFAVIFFIIVYTYRYKPITSTILIAFGLILGGAIGNIIDRIRFGCVVDFFDFRIWPVFNIADSSITIGVIMLAWRSIFRK